MKKKALLYVHGKGGSAREAEHYRELFPERDVLGLDYPVTTPWEAGPVIRREVERLAEQYERIALAANSIGAFFSMTAGIDRYIEKAYMISPIVDMERLIGDMMDWAGVTEDMLKSQSEIETAFGETLSWAYLCWVREHPVRWRVQTEILCGERDHLTAQETMRRFAKAHGVGLTVMPGGEHWFHTPEQMAFLDEWIFKKEHDK